MAASHRTDSLSRLATHRAAESDHDELIGMDVLDEGQRRDPSSPTTVANLLAHGTCSADTSSNLTTPDSCPGPD